MTDFKFTPPEIKKLTDILINYSISHNIHISELLQTILSFSGLDSSEKTSIKKLVHQELWDRREELPFKVNPP